MENIGLIEKLRKWWSAASAALLLAVASLGVIYDVLHRFGFKHIVDPLASPEEVLILLVALLCGGLGAERLLTLRKIETDIETAKSERATLLTAAAQISERIEKLSTRVGRLRSGVVADLKDVNRLEEDIITAVNRINKAEALVGPKEIEAAACRLVEDCDDSEKIKATGQYRTGDGLSDSYFKNLAERVKRAQENRGSMEYHVVVPANHPIMDDRHKDKREEAFKTSNIEERLIMRRAKQPWPFEVLIGGHSMIIALLSGNAKSNYEVAVKITDSDFVEKAAEWFREVAWEDSEK